MKCILKFLSDRHQKDLRRLAQHQSESYEECLEKYKKIFIANFLDVKVTCCGNQKEENNLCENCEQFKEIIENIKKEKIENFFNILKEVYILWIDAKLSDAIDKFKELLKDYKILDMQAKDIEKSVFFKGRSEKNILTKWDMFHIPFNKRYLIQNQRYSLTGQPMIYMGKSVLDIVEELGIEEEDKLKVSSIIIKSPLKIYDLRNDIFKDITEIEYCKLLGLDSTTAYDEKKFFKNILASVCSFEKRREHKGYSFCEEYVIPQMLAQIINKDYDGIIYYSTKRFREVEFTNCNKNNIERFRKSQYKENIAVFTKYDNQHVYDHGLYDKLEISVPIDISKIEHIAIDDLEEIYEKIKNTGIQDISKKSDLLISTLKREFDCISINTKKYSDTYMGQLHIYHIYCILNQILFETVKE